MTKTLTFLFMDAPYESATSMTVLRLIDSAIRKGYNVNVAAYEGAVAYTAMAQKPAPVEPRAGMEGGSGPIFESGRHLDPRECVVALMKAAQARGVKLDWLRCDVCEDERGLGEPEVGGTRRGAARDFWAQVEASTNVLVIPTR